MFIQECKKYVNHFKYKVKSVFLNVITNKPIKLPNKHRLHSPIVYHLFIWDLEPYINMGMDQEPSINDVTGVSTFVIPGIKAYEEQQC